MTIEAINAVGVIEPSLTVDSIKNKANVEFEDLLTGGIQNVNESLSAADSVLSDMALNKPVSAHEVMLTMEKAKFELRLVIEVRNKLLESYQELMRMQV